MKIQLCNGCAEKNRLDSAKMMLTVASDDRSFLFVDGMFVGETIGYSPMSFSISRKSKLIAVKVINILLHVAFIAQISTNISTDTTWRCMASVVGNDWIKLKYDDSLWLQVVLFVSNRNGYTLMPTLNAFPANTFWISVVDNKFPVMSCRKLL